MRSDFDVEGKNKLQKAIYYMQYYGVSYTMKRALRKFGVSINDESEYMTWCRRNTASKVELKSQRKDSISKRLSFVIVSETGTNVEQSGWKKQTCKQASFVTLTQRIFWWEAQGNILCFPAGILKSGQSICMNFRLQCAGN